MSSIKRRKVGCHEIRDEMRESDKGTAEKASEQAISEITNSQSAGGGKLAVFRGKGCEWRTRQRFLSLFY